MVKTEKTTDDNDVSDGVNNIEKHAADLAIRLTKEVLDHPSSPDPEKCIDLLKEMANLTVSMALLERTKIGKLLTKATKTFKRHQRTATNDESTIWDTALEMATKLLDKWKSEAGKEEKSKASIVSTGTNRTGLPRTVVEYRARLVTQKKELFKDPPVLPPGKIAIEPIKCAPPKRDKSTGALTFVSGTESRIDSLLKDFRPNRTPEGKL